MQRKNFVFAGVSPRGRNFVTCSPQILKLQRIKVEFRMRPCTSVCSRCSTLQAAECTTQSERASSGETHVRSKPAGSRDVLSVRLSACRRSVWSLREWSSLRCMQYMLVYAVRRMEALNVAACITFSIEITVEKWRVSVVSLLYIHRIRIEITIQLLYLRKNKNRWVRTWRPMWTRPRHRVFDLMYFD